MNLIVDTQNNLIEAMQHYFCMRLKFRGTVLQDKDDRVLNIGGLNCSAKSTQNRH